MVETIADQIPLAVCVRLTARPALESLQVTILTVGVALVAHTVRPLTRPLSVALALLHALLVLTDETLRTVRVETALRVAAGVGEGAGAADQVGQVGAVLVSAALRVLTDVIRAGAADSPRTAGVVPAPGPALPGEHRGVAPLGQQTVVVIDAARVLGGRGGGGRRGRAGGGGVGRRGGGGGWRGGGEAHYSRSKGPVTHRSLVPLISAVEQEPVIGIALIIGTGSTGEQTGTLGAAFPELGAI